MGARPNPRRMYFTQIRPATFIYVPPLAQLLLLILLMGARAVPQEQQSNEPLGNQPKLAANELLVGQPTVASQPTSSSVQPAQVEPLAQPVAGDQVKQPQVSPTLPQPQDPSAPGTKPTPAAGQPDVSPPNPELPSNDQQQTLTTVSPHRLSTVIPELDFNKDILDYGDALLADLQFSLPTTPPVTDPDEYARSLINTHHNNDQLYEYLLQLAQRYPKITRLHSIGQSVEGRKLWVLEISERPGKHEPLKPEFRYIANMHGNEVVGRELLLHLARLILENYYATDDDEPQNKDRPSGHKFIKKLVQATRIHLMPSMNPDGYERSAVGCKWESPSRKGRLNSNNVDLNRNFPNSIIETKLDAGTQPETRAVMDWSKREPFVLSANLHGGALVAVIPWDSSLNRSTLGKADERKCPDHETFMDLGRAYTKSHGTMSDGKMCYDKCTEYHPEVFPDDGVTTGSGWYQFYGSLMEWSYENTNDFQLTLELGCNMYPPAESLIQYWDMNKVAMLNFMRQVHRGIKGMVLDAQSGAPLAHVHVHVRSIDHNVTTGVVGDYFRLLAPGQYRVLYERAGYETEEVFIDLGQTMAQIHNIKLKPNGSPAAEIKDGGDTSPSSSGVADQSDAPTMVEPLRGPGDGQAHPVAVATLVMSVVTVLLLILLAGAYVIQRRRFARSQSVSVEMQPTGRSSSGTGMSLPPIKSTVTSGTIGGPLSTHLQT